MFAYLWSCRYEMLNFVDLIVYESCIGQVIVVIQILLSNEYNCELSKFNK